MLRYPHMISFNVTLLKIKQCFLQLLNHIFNLNRLR